MQAQVLTGVRHHAQAVGGRFHEARMEGSGHRQWQRALGTHGLEHFAGLVDSRLAAGDHGLGSVVEVHCLDHLSAARTEALAGLAAALDYLGRV